MTFERLRQIPAARASYRNPPAGTVRRRDVRYRRRNGLPLAAAGGGGHDAQLALQQGQRNGPGEAERERRRGR